MKILRVYIDTSVIGGCFDAEFVSWSNGLMQDFRQGHFRAVNIELGYKPVQIYSPREVTSYGTDEDQSG
jgi:hypothetical protein